MKNSILITVAMAFFSLIVFTQNSYTLNNYAQDVRFEVSGKYSRAIKKDKLTEAKSLNDIIPYYPNNWITEYTSAEIFAYCNGKPMSAVGTNNILSAEQKNV